MGSGQKVLLFAVLLACLIFVPSSNAAEEKKDKETCWEKFLNTIGVGTVAAPIATAAGNLMLKSAGFTAAGIGQGTLAATAQAWMGTIGAGSIFAGLQSLGASGGLAVFGPVGLGAGALAAGYYYVTADPCQQPGTALDVRCPKK